VFGIAGVEGNGQRELVEALAGMRPKQAGRVVLDGHDITRATPRGVIELGVGHVPEDRTKHGLVGPFTISDNLVLNQFRNSPFARRGLRREDEIAAHARTLVEQYDIRTPSPFVPVETLSGGNQQKVIIARELNGVDRLLIVAQPTRGLDVGSIEFIHRRIIEMRDQGAAVLLVSAELDEVLNLADRVGVIYRGSLVGTFDRSEVTRDQVGLYMASGREAIGSTT
jgi:ABC-type uncharacterized transport system ATPase subunit